MPIVGPQLTRSAGNLGAAYGTNELGSNASSYVLQSRMRTSTLVLLKRPQL